MPVADKAPQGFLFDTTSPTRELEAMTLLNKGSSGIFFDATSPTRGLEAMTLLNISAKNIAMDQRWVWLISVGVTSYLNFQFYSWA